MNENKKLAGAAEESTSIPSEPEMQTANDSQQNIKTEKDISSADGSASDSGESDFPISSEQAEMFMPVKSDGDDAFFDDEEILGERILPPDELFSARSKPESAAVVFPDTLEEDTADDDGAEDFSEHEDDGESLEILDEDGQYTLGELELQRELSDKYFAEEEMPEYDPKKPRKIDGRFDLVELFVFTLLAVMIVTTFFFRHSVVDGSSMENTLHDGEHLIISDFFYTPQRKDIIVCEDYTTKIPKPIVKRVIGIPGDRVQISADGTVRINGEPLREDYVFVDRYYQQEPIDIVVPEGEIFVMGDHRNVSADSREIGTVSIDSVLGKVLLRFYPFNKFGTVN